MSTMKIKKIGHERVNGTSLLGFISTTYAQLVHTFGPPSDTEDGCKVDAEWWVEINGVPLTIYNYKSGQAWNGPTGRPNVMITNWNIGGHSESRPMAVRLVEKAIFSGCQAKEREQGPEGMEPSDAEIAHMEEVEAQDPGGYDESTNPSNGWEVPE